MAAKKKAAAKKTAAKKTDIVEIDGVKVKKLYDEGNFMKYTKKLDQMGILTSRNACECDPKKVCTCGRRVLVNFKNQKKAFIVAQTIVMNRNGCE